jgi:AcrR family transcriptional regulator
MKPSKLAGIRQAGKHQVDKQRSHILDIAEKLFLQNGLDHTKMIDIAAQAGITKITLYRYFPNRDVIALEIHIRMMKKITDTVELRDQGFTQDNAKKLVQAMIRNFHELREAYRYMGMFDHSYLDNPPESPLAQWTKLQIMALMKDEADQAGFLLQGPQAERLHVVMSTVVWFLEKLALRGEVTWSSKDVPLDVHLKLFEDMIISYIDQSIDTQ